MIAGKRITELRESHGLTQALLAEKININRSVLNRIELGTRAIRDTELLALARFFHVTTDYILGNEPTTESTSNTDTDTATETTNSGVIGAIGGDNHGNITANFTSPVPAKATTPAQEVQNLAISLQNLSPEAIKILKATLNN